MSKKMCIRSQNATVYFSPTAKRRFLTKGAAIAAEARALISNKHPAEPAEHDDSGGLIYSGFHWRELPRSEVLYRRVVRLVKGLIYE